MELLYTIGAPNPQFCVCERESIRGILFDGSNRLTMVTSVKHIDCCFPGGGKEPGESDIDTLVREVMEEIGYRVDPDSVRDFGRIDMYRKDRHLENTNFHQINKYYLCLGEKIGEPHLSPNEASIGVSTINVSVAEAITINENLFERGDLWVDRDLLILRKLKNQL